MPPGQHAHPHVPPYVFQITGVPCSNVLDGFWLSHVVSSRGERGRCHLEFGVRLSLWAGSLQHARTASYSYYRLVAAEHPEVCQMATPQLAARGGLGWGCQLLNASFQPNEQQAAGCQMAGSGRR